MKTDTQELKRQIHNYIVARSKNGCCNIAFSEIAEWFKISQRKAVQSVNALTKEGKLEFDTCLEAFGSGDYLNRYRVC